jgi:hypothetical protein
VIREVVHEWNSIHSEDRDIVLMPVGWESHSSPSMGDRPQAIINRQVLEGCDLLIAVFWTRLGTPTQKSASGTAEEIEEHLAAGKPAMIYFSSAPVAPESVDQRQLKALVQFRENLRKRGLIETYDSIVDFREKLSRQLAQSVIRAFAPKKNGRVNGKAVPPDAHEIPALSDYAKQLLIEASHDREGLVLQYRTNKGLRIETNGWNLAEGSDAKTQTRWAAALRQLREFGLLQERGSKGEVFSVTDEGFRVAELVSGQRSVILPQ